MFLIRELVFKENLIFKKSQAKKEDILFTIVVVIIIWVNK